MKDVPLEFHPTPTPIERLLQPFRRFVRTESSSGVVLLLAAVFALVWANSPWAESYHHLWESPVRLSFGTREVGLSLHHVINDALMAVFFFLVGLEIKREVLVGELASRRAAALPIAAAIGGMLVPASIYLVINRGGPGEMGWGIPMATDIAFALGVLALIGRGVPVGLKVFLAALAIVDDLGAVLVIALFYTNELNVGALSFAAAALGVLVLMNRLGVRQPGAYALVGLLLWSAFLTSGVHATVAGVLAAMTIPARTRINSSEFLRSGRAVLDEFERARIDGRGVLSNARELAAIQTLESRCESAQAPLQRIEHDLQLWVAFGVMPIFAFANAGVSFGGHGLETALHPVTVGILLGLLLGKPLGIVFFSWLAVRSGAASLPGGVSWKGITGIGFLGGIGFTMSLFIATLGFGEGSSLLDFARIAILAASLVAATAGWLLLRSGITVSAPVRELAPRVAHGSIDAGGSGDPPDRGRGSRGEADRGLAVS